MKNKMRVLLLTTKPPWPEHDGGAVASSRIITGLTFNGAEVHLLSLTTPKHAASDILKTAKEKQVISCTEVHVDTTISKIQLLKNLLFSRLPYDLQRFYSPEAVKSIRELCKKESFDIIQCEGLVFSLYASEIRDVTNAKIVLRAHNTEHLIRSMMAGRENNIFRRIYLFNLSERIKRIESHTRKIFDAVVTISETDADWFNSLDGNAPVFISPTGVVTASGKGEIKPRGNNVGFIGSLDWAPNTDGLIWFVNEVWPRIVSKIPDACLNIAGRNANRETQKSFTGKNIVFHGEVDNALAFTQSMRLMIAPLFSGSGMRIKIIEAMDAGVPVIASPVAAKGLPVEDGKDIIIAPDADSFSSGVAGLLKNDLLANKIASNAVNTIKSDFDNNSITSKLVEFYKTLL
jgi:polysaccharide biosynthesis protein PslH